MSSTRTRTLYEAAVVLAALALLVLGIGLGGLEGVRLRDGMTFGAALTLAFLLPIPLAFSPAAVHFVDFPITLGMLLTFGPTAAGLVSSATCWVAPVRLGRARFHRRFCWTVAFNMATTVLSTQVAGSVFRAFGGTYLTAGLSGTSALAALLASGALIGTHVAAASLDIFFITGQSWVKGWLQNVVMALPSSLVLTPFSLVMAAFYPRHGWIALVPFILPFGAAWHWTNTRVRCQRIYRSTVGLLGHAMYHFDAYTREHEEAVAKHAVRIARHLGCPDATVDLLRCAGRLHDIGKIAWGESLLGKEGTLTPDELLQIRQHPADGARIIRDIRYLNTIAPWVERHHERWDGRGYPGGWEQDAIPFEATILAVADSFHAMQSPERRYRKPMTEDEALAEIQRCAGKQFNPRVVQALVELTELERSESGNG